MANIKNTIKQCCSDPFIRKLVFSWGLFLGAIYIARDMSAAEDMAAAEMAAAATAGVADQAGKLAGEVGPSDFGKIPFEECVIVTVQATDGT